MYFTYLFIFIHIVSKYLLKLLYTHGTQYIIIWFILCFHVKLWQKGLWSRLLSWLDFTKSGSIQTWCQIDMGKLGRKKTLPNLLLHLTRKQQSLQTLWQNQRMKSSTIKFVTKTKTVSPKKTGKWSSKWSAKNWNKFKTTFSVTLFDIII